MIRGYWEDEIPPQNWTKQGETPDAAEKRIQAVQMPGEGHGRLFGYGRLFGHGLLILLKAPTRLGRPNSQLEQKTQV